MTVNYTTYTNDKNNFFKKHKNDFKTYTSSMNDYGVYHKEYVFKDGATWYEVMSPEYVKQEVEVKCCKIEIEVKMFRTEYFNSDDSHTKFYYEKF